MSSEINAMSLAKTVSVINVGCCHLLLLLSSLNSSYSSFPSVACIILLSRTIANRKGASVSSCRTPASISKKSVFPSSVKIKTRLELFTRCIP